ncbi:MAG: RNA polymerase sigma factor [Rhizobiaceae bacterium]|nr:RNA polymerase sigma factor [Rhizobiaceae bacterium]
MTAMMLQAKEPADGELAARASEGDRSAFGALVERHYDFVYRVAFRFAGQRGEAEDIAQEVCARLGRSIRSYRGGSAFTTWLYAIVANASRDFLRGRAREASRAEAYRVHALIDGEANETDADNDPAEALWAAVRQLPDKQCQAVTLVYGEGLSHAQAAELMAVAEPTVSWHIHEAKKRLKALLGEAEDQ